MSVISSGSVVIRASQSGNSSFEAASDVDQTLTITKVSQTITFGSIANQTLNTGTLTLGATASSSLPVTYSSDNTSVATVSGSVVTFVAAGTANITASQAGDSIYDVATPVTQNLVITSSTTWTPSQITTLGWYDASDSSTITVSGGAITNWADKSGNNNDLTRQGNPVTGSSTQNSLNVIDLDGDDYFTKNNFSNPTSGDLQAIIVCETDQINASSDAIISQAGSGRTWQLDAGNNTEFRGKLQVAGQSKQSSGVGSGAITGFNIFCASLDLTDDGKYEFLLNGVLRNGTTSRDYTNAINSSANLIIFGNRTASVKSPSGKVAEVVIYESQSDSDRQKVEGYLAHKWGLESKLAPNHPYSSSAPTT